jgi:long-subunit acyl-CoA synthetase (AMP-forming)
MMIVSKLLNKFYPIIKALYNKLSNHDKARSMFGGKLKYIGTGSASVSPDFLLFYVKH